MRLVALAASVLAPACALAASIGFPCGETFELRDWEFRRESGAWERVRVPHDWAIAGPFDKEIDKQVVKILENVETKASGRTATMPLKWNCRGRRARPRE